jgi:hypothetical protein
MCGSKEKTKPLTHSQKKNERREKKKESKYIPKKTSKKKKLTPKKQEQTHNKKKEKEKGQLPWRRWYNVTCTTFLRQHNHCSPNTFLMEGAI